MTAMANNIKQRNGCITAWLWFVIIANIGTVIFLSVSMFEDYLAETALGLGLCSILGVINILGAILLMRWNKTGFYLFVISSLISAIINIFIMQVDASVAIGSLSVILIWRAILQVRSNGVSAWSQMQSGWDYKHTRHLYQVFSIIGITLFILTLIAAGRNHKNSESEYVTAHIADIIEEPAESVEVVEDEIPAIDAMDVVEEDVIVVEKTVEPQQKKEMPRQEVPSYPPRKDSSVHTDDDASSEQQSADQQLKAAIEQGNKAFPQDLGMGVVVIRVYLSGNYVMYVAECDEEKISMDLLEQNKSSLLNDMRKMAENNSNSDIAQFFKICANAGKGIGYTYVGDSSGRKVTVLLTNAELKKLI